MIVVDIAGWIANIFILGLAAMIWLTFVIGVVILVAVLIRQVRRLSSDR